MATTIVAKTTPVWITNLNDALGQGSEILALTSIVFTIALSILTLVLLLANYKLSKSNQRQSEKLQRELAKQSKDLQESLFDKNHALQQQFLTLEEKNSGFLKDQIRISDLQAKISDEQTKLYKEQAEAVNVQNRILDNQREHNERTYIQDKIYELDARYHQTYDEIYLTAYAIDDNKNYKNNAKYRIDEIPSDNRVMFRRFWLVQKEQRQLYLDGILETRIYASFVYSRYRDFMFFITQIARTNFEFTPHASQERYYNDLHVQREGKSFVALWRYWSDQVFSISRDLTDDDGIDLKHSYDDVNLIYRRMIDHLADKARAVTEGGTNFDAMEHIEKEIVKMREAHHRLRSDI